MKKKIFFTHLFLFLIAVCSFVSCSKDDDMGDGKGPALIINGEPYFPDYEENMPRLRNNGNYYSCDCYVYSKDYDFSLDSYHLYFYLSTDLKEGDALDDFKFEKFASGNTLIETSSNYISGKVTVIKRSDSQITLKFSKYNFYVDRVTSSLDTTKGKEFTIDGELTLFEK